MNLPPLGPEPAFPPTDNERRQQDGYGANDHEYTRKPNWWYIAQPMLEHNVTRVEVIVGRYEIYRYGKSG